MKDERGVPEKDGSERVGWDGVASSFLRRLSIFVEKKEEKTEGSSWSVNVVGRGESLEEPRRAFIVEKSSLEEVALRIRLRECSVLAEEIMLETLVLCA